MIYYRATENIYCKAFGAMNVSRTDCTADAIYNLDTGVGIKTFLDRPGGSFQKIAEFNKQEPLYKSLSGLDLIKEIAKLRNDRIESTLRIYGLKHFIYHCILRNEDGYISIFEEPLVTIDIPNIRINSSSDSKKCLFTDGKEQYEFFYSKSTLFKHFDQKSPFLRFKVEILSDPLSSLVQLIGSSSGSTKEDMKKPRYPSLVVPLYSYSKKQGRFVAEHSGLNQWNAKPRTRFDKIDHHPISSKDRNPNEVYIPLPIKLRRDNPNFFPARYIPWDLRLPNGRVISMTVCQDDGKALMSKPNKDLGKWILRDVLKVPEKTLLTYSDLLRIGIDSIKFEKISDTEFQCDFVENEDADINKDIFDD